jgi:hypothetical protein
MQNNGIKLQCYFYLTDFIENKTAIRPDSWTVCFPCILYCTSI